MKQGWAVAAAFEARVDLDLRPALDVIERQHRRVVNEACNAQAVIGLGDLRLIVMLDNIKVVHGCVERLYLARIEEVNGAGNHGWRCERRRNIRERYERLVLSKRKLGPKRHAGCGSDAPNR